MSYSYITLTTDFGVRGSYVAQMKGVILSTCPNATIVDVTHEIVPQNVRQAAMVLDEIHDCFPSRTIHVCVVDPGVGSDREILLARIGGQDFIAPDNGVFSLVLKREPDATIIALDNAKYWRASVSSTFHGRDIMAPVAAHLANGVDRAKLGQRRAQPMRLVWPEVEICENQMRGEIIHIDSFGNLITNVTKRDMDGVPAEKRCRFMCMDRETRSFVRYYAEAEKMSLVALWGSSGRLELAVCGGSAVDMLKAKLGDSVIIRW